MLTLNRRSGDEIVLQFPTETLRELLDAGGCDVRIVFGVIRGDLARVSFDAPKTIRILRGEIVEEGGSGLSSGGSEGGAMGAGA